MIAEVFGECTIFRCTHTSTTLACKATVIKKCSNKLPINSFIAMKISVWCRQSCQTIIQRVDWVYDRQTSITKLVMPINAVVLL